MANSMPDQVPPGSQMREPTQDFGGRGRAWSQLSLGLKYLRSPLRARVVSQPPRYPVSRTPILSSVVVE